MTTIDARLTTALATALLLTSCATEDEPVPIFEKSTAAPTPSKSPNPEKDPHRSPKALIRHWNHLQNEMQLGDTKAWRELTPNCQTCIQAADQVDNFYTAGGFIQTDGRTIRSIENESGSTYRVTLDSSSTEYRESAESEVKKLAGGQGVVYHVHLVRDGASWEFWDYAQVAQ